VQPGIGHELTSARLSDWLAERGVGQAFVERGGPQQNAYVERFNGGRLSDLRPRSRQDRGEF
jgi:transposase InsO family protein